MKVVRRTVSVTRRCVSGQCFMTSVQGDLNVWMDLDAKSLFLLFFLFVYVLIVSNKVCYAPRKYLYTLIHLEDS